MIHHDDIIYLPMENKLNKEERIELAERCRLLADYLEQLKPGQFDYDSLRGGLNEFGVRRDSLPFKSLDNCGTTGCALGWAPFVPDERFKPVEDDYEKDDLTGSRYLSFYDYEGRVFFGHYLNAIFYRQTDEMLLMRTEYQIATIIRQLRRVAELLPDYPTSGYITGMVNEIVKDRSYFVTPATE